MTTNEMDPVVLPLVVDEPRSCRGRQARGRSPAEPAGELPGSVAATVVGGASA